MNIQILGGGVIKKFRFMIYQPKERLYKLQYRLKW